MLKHVSIDVNVMGGAPDYCLRFICECVQSLKALRVQIFADSHVPDRDIEAAHYGTARHDGIVKALVDLQISLVVELVVRSTSDEIKDEYQGFVNGVLDGKGWLHGREMLRVVQTDEGYSAWRWCLRP